MRGFLIACVVTVAAVLAIAQASADCYSREVAQPGSLVSALPSCAAAPWVDWVVARGPESLRYMSIRAAVHDGRPTAAQRTLTTLRPGPERMELAGFIAEDRGELAAAERAYLAASDADGITRMVGRERVLRRLPRARELLRAQIAGLGAGSTQPDALAEAWWQLGTLDAVYGASSLVQARAALADFTKAQSLAPFSEKYALSVGSQYMNLRDLDRAGATFARAVEIDPQSAVAYAALGEVALLRNDRVAARAQLIRAQTLDPSLASVKALASKLARL